ncbi:hypothetical protein NPIL_210021, partial [Nephila pilipes]
IATGVGRDPLNVVCGIETLLVQDGCMERCAESQLRHHYHPAKLTC